MKTTVDIPEGLLKRAKKITHAKSNEILFVMALENIILNKQLSNIPKISNYKGKVDLDIDLDVLRDRK